MKNYYTLLMLLFTFVSQSIVSQEILQTDQGSNYKHTVFVDLESQEQTTIDFTTWDIAFTTDAMGAGVLVNEATINGAEEGVHLFLTYADDFADVNMDHIVYETFNEETSWENGAFNSVAEPGDPFDYGWGSYDMDVHQVLGTRIFIIQLRDNSYRKIKIDKFDTRQFVFTYAQLDGSDEVVDSVQLEDYDGKTLVYYSIKDQKVLDLEPDSWDVQFTRYNTPVEEGETGEFQDYQVTGVLSNAGTRVVRATDVDPETVKFEEYQDGLTFDLDAIGYEWKYFDLGSFQYSVIENEVYFVKTSTDQVYKIQFLDFEGASTGVTTYQVSPEGTFTSVKSERSFVESSSIYPNPVIAGNFNLEFTSNENIDGTVHIYNMMGVEVYQSELQILQGYNKSTINLTVEPGNYIVNIRTPAGSHNIFLIIQ